MKRFVLQLPQFNSQVVAEIRVINNPNRPGYGKCRIFTDMQYNPLTEADGYQEPMSQDEAEQRLLSLGFIQKTEQE